MSPLFVHCGGRGHRLLCLQTDLNHPQSNSAETIQSPNPLKYVVDLRGRARANLLQIVVVALGAHQAQVCEL